MAVVAMGVGAMLAVGVAPANAASSNGAQVNQNKDCSDYGYATSCYDSHSVSNTVHTPSGNTIRVYNGKHDSTTEYDSGYSYSSEGSSHSQSLVKDGRTHESHSRHSSTYSNPNRTCTSESAYHYANGTQQFGEYDYSCL